jgi:alginate O-acetyltransferase complex protein AlgJ
MTRTEARLVSCLFVALIAWPPILGLFGVRGAAIENRRLTARPPFTIARLLDQGFYLQLSDFLRDHLPLRDVLVRTNSFMALHLWRDSPNPEVHIGRGDWLFTTSFRARCPAEMPLSAADRLGELGRTFRAANREMRFILAPNKATLYPEFLGAFPPADFTCGIERLAELRARLARIPEVGFIDVWSHLWQLKERAVEPLYFPGDSHWTPRVAGEMSRVVVDSIEPGLWSDASVVVTRQIMLPMDLATLIGTPRSVPVELTETRRSDVTSQVVETQDCADGPVCVVRYRSTSATAKLITKRTLLIRDSFGTMAMPTLTPYFADITYLFWSNDLEQQLRARVKDADLVIYESFDAFLFDRLDQGFAWMKILPQSTAR